MRNLINYSALTQRLKERKESDNEKRTIDHISLIFNDTPTFPLTSESPRINGWLEIIADTRTTVVISRSWSLNSILSSSWFGAGCTHIITSDLLSHHLSNVLLSRRSCVHTLPHFIDTQVCSNLCKQSACCTLVFTFDFLRRMASVPSSHGMVETSNLFRVSNIQVLCR